MIKTESPVCIGGHVQIQGWKSPLQKFRDERIKRSQNMCVCRDYQNIWKPFFWSPVCKFIVSQEETTPMPPSVGAHKIDGLPSVSAASAAGNWTSVYHSSHG